MECFLWLHGLRPRCSAFPCSCILCGGVLQHLSNFRTMFATAPLAGASSGSRSVHEKGLVNFTGVPSLELAAGRLTTGADFGTVGGFAHESLACAFTANAASALARDA